MATTPLGFTYPANTDGPTGPTQIQQLATDIDTYLSGFAPVTWTNLTPASGFIVGSVVPQVCRIGRAVYFQGLISPTSGNFTASSTLTLVAAGGVPAGFRPGQTRNVTASQSGTLSVRMIISTAGVIQIVTASTTSTTVDLAALSGYPAEA